MSKKVLTSEGQPPQIPFHKNVSDQNLFYMSPNHPEYGTGVEMFILGPSRFNTLEAAQQAGRELNSVWRNPQFRDATGGDFRLLPAE